MNKRNQGWFPRSRAAQTIVINNLKAKIGDYEVILPLSTGKITRTVLICDTFLALINYVEQTRATGEYLTEYQNMILTGEGGVQNALVPPPPIYNSLLLPVGAFVGILSELNDIVEDIKAADNYNSGIGDDLMIVAPVGGDIVKDELQAAIKPVVLANHKVRVEGSLQGMKAMRVEYLKKGANIPQSFFLTKLPADISVALTVAGEPESGHLRAVLIQDNDEVGQFSPDYPVTVG